MKVGCSQSSHECADRKRKRQTASGAGRRETYTYFDSLIYQSVKTTQRKKKRQLKFEREAKEGESERGSEKKNPLEK